jgi:hypothetical protein
MRYTNHLLQPTPLRSHRHPYPHYLMPQLNQKFPSLSNQLPRTPVRPVTLTMMAIHSLRKLSDRMLASNVDEMFRLRRLISHGHSRSNTYLKSYSQRFPQERSRGSHCFLFSILMLFDTKNAHCRWAKISKAMSGRRTPRQVASRVQKYFEKLKKFGVEPG